MRHKFGLRGARQRSESGGSSSTWPSATRSKSEEYKLNQNLLATPFVIASHLVPDIELSFDEVPRHLKDIQKHATAQSERVRELGDTVAELEAKADT